jgi:hypothetical protein
MDIEKFVRSVADKDIEELLARLKREYDKRKADEIYRLEKGKSGVLIIDFLDNSNISGNLRKILYNAWYEGLYTTLDDITYQNFIAIRRAGKKGFCDLLDAVAKIIKERKFEQNNTSLIKHFKKHGRGMFYLPDSQIYRSPIREGT